MHNRGDSAGEALNWQSTPFDSWTITEHDINYLLKSNQGLSPGLFLDQYDNRLWVKNNSKDLRVLNLFSYTAGFGLCAASAGAKEVLNVDTSKRTLEWAKENAALNKLEMHYSAMDVRSFLKMALRQNRTFDLIICDPPSFARNKSGVFKLEKDLPELCQSILTLLSPGAKALICTNFEQWGQKRFKEHITLKLSQESFRLKTPSTHSGSFLSQDGYPLMKSVFLIKQEQDKKN